jgi:hypothetical protein
MLADLWHASVELLAHAKGLGARNVLE